MGKRGRGMVFHICPAFFCFFCFVPIAHSPKSHQLLSFLCHLHFFFARMIAGTLCLTLPSMRRMAVSATSLSSLSGVCVCVCVCVCLCIYVCMHICLLVVWMDSYVILKTQWKYIYASEGNTPGPFYFSFFFYAEIALSQKKEEKKLAHQKFFGTPPRHFLLIPLYLISSAHPPSSLSSFYKQVSRYLKDQAQDDLRCIQGCSP